MFENSDNVKCEEMSGKKKKWVIKRKTQKSDNNVAILKNINDTVQSEQSNEYCVIFIHEYV
jgi:predicted kinase